LSSEDDILFSDFLYFESNLETPTNYVNNHYFFK